MISVSIHLIDPAVLNSHLDIFPRYATLIKEEFKTEQEYMWCVQAYISLHEYITNEDDRF